MSSDEIIKPILRDITINEISDDDDLSERSIIYLSYQEAISKLVIKCNKENLYFLNEKEKIQFMLSVDNVLYISEKYTNKLREMFSSYEIEVITLYIFRDLTSLLIDSTLDIGLVFKSDRIDHIKETKGIPLIYYKDEKTFYENVGPTTTYFFYDDYDNNFVGDFLDLKKFRKK
tara:strand:- start:5856 stop:6377 length:522 start_codon:yes stop_codon:yes gene_type:complete